MSEALPPANIADGADEPWYVHDRRAKLLHIAPPRLPADSGS